MTVSGGKITDITIESYQYAAPYFNAARSSVFDEIISSQSVDVSTVIGATFSSNGIIEAVADALGISYSGSTYGAQGPAPQEFGGERR